jgi:hypothetical protein
MANSTVEIENVVFKRPARVGSHPPIEEDAADLNFDQWIETTNRRPS